MLLTSYIIFVIIIPELFLSVFHINSFIEESSIKPHGFSRWNYFKESSPREWLMAGFVFGTFSAQIAKSLCLSSSNSHCLNQLLFSLLLLNSLQVYPRRTGKQAGGNIFILDRDHNTTGFLCHYNHDLDEEENESPHIHFLSSFLQ